MDKRKATSREELHRMFQEAGLLHGDEIPANGLAVADLDLPYFRDYYERVYEAPLEEEQLPATLKNMNLSDGDFLNVAGALLFARNPQSRLPAFLVKAVWFPGREIDVDHYLDSRDITRKIRNPSPGIDVKRFRRLQGISWSTIVLTMWPSINFFPFWTAFIRQ
ncbi:MAG: hypothetical protein LBQ42_09815 [Synergistaceae bacterium]|jgi:ATP-dependent DNA helicase RecG|nr:hypothetical protein [Synergistaceae bacterium]